MGVTKVSLKPLKKISQLSNLKANSCVSLGDEGDGMFTLTFQIDNSEGNELLQDLTIIFDKGKPQAFISLPYHWNNAKKG